MRAQVKLDIDQRLREALAEESEGSPVPSPPGSDVPSPDADMDFDPELGGPHTPKMECDSPSSWSMGEVTKIYNFVSE